MRGEEAKRPGIQVIARASAVLRALERRPDGLSLGELANDVGLPRSTVQRLVDALAADGFVLGSSATGGGVRLGPTLVALAAATRFPLAELARDTLRALSDETGETVDLSLFDHDEAVFIDQIAGRHRLAVCSAVGIVFPLHSSANGKAMLAAMSDAELARFHKRRLPALTPNTITSWARLDREIEVVRARGVAYDREEHSLGISAVGVAIRSPSGAIAAISIPAPTQRFLATEDALTGALLAHSSQLKAQLTR